MGVRFYANNKENMSGSDDYTTATTTTACKNCHCNTCNLSTSSDPRATQSSNVPDNSNNPKLKKSGILREIVGNCKEMRVDENVHNLRIVGNNNRIRISQNVGDITIVGNNTRLKIKTNHGLLKYTGNDGRICLGKHSTEQLVDYSGCNGVLKVQNSKKFCKVNHGDDNRIKNNSATGNTSISGNLINSKKSHNDYNNIFNSKKSTPNMTNANAPFGENMPSTSNKLPKSIVHNFGDIVIANSSNICISPYTNNYN